MFTERISYQTRYFIPAEKDTVKILDEVLKISPVNRVEQGKEHNAAKSYAAMGSPAKQETEAAAAKRMSAKSKPSILADLQDAIASIKETPGNGKKAELSI